MSNQITEEEKGSILVLDSDTETFEMELEEEYFDNWLDSKEYLNKEAVITISGYGWRNKSGHKIYDKFNYKNLVQTFTSDFSLTLYNDLTGQFSDHDTPTGASIKLLPRKYMEEDLLTYFNANLEIDLSTAKKKYYINGNRILYMKKEVIFAENFADESEIIELTIKHLELEELFLLYQAIKEAINEFPVLRKLL